MVCCGEPGSQPYGEMERFKKTIHVIVTSKLMAIVRGLVAPAKEIGSYCRQAEERANAIFPEAHLRAWLVMPIHRHLLDSVAELLRDEEHFSVKAPVIDER